MKPLATEVAVAGLTRGLEALSDAPLSEAYVQALAGITEEEGHYGFIEAGARPLKPLSIFARAGHTGVTGWQAGLGARWTF